MGENEIRKRFELVTIFMAFVAVTTLFSLVSLGTGAFGDGPVAGVNGYPILTADEPYIALSGEITGSLSTQEPAESHIDTLTFRIAHTGEDKAVDLSQVTMTVMTGDYLEILPRSRSSLAGPGMWMAMTPPGSDALLEPGKECTIRLHLDRPVPANGDLTIKMRPEGCWPCTITGPVSLLVAGAGVSSLTKN